MKRRRLIALFLSVTILCTGCGASGIQLSEEENNMIAEYIAGLLLKYDYNYDEKLVYDTEDESAEDSLSEMIQTNAVTSDVNAPNSQTSSDTTNTEENKNQTSDSNYESVNETKTEDYKTISEVFRSEKCSVSFNKARECQSYPAKSENSYFLLEANNNKKLLVLSFNIKNDTKEKKDFCLINSGISYRLEDSQGKSNKPLLTALTDDLQYFDVQIEAGKTTRAVILFEVPKDSSLDSYTLYIEKDDMTAQVSLS